jgi:hypothetical protein
LNRLKKPLPQALNHPGFHQIEENCLWSDCLLVFILDESEKKQSYFGRLPT